jgi:hypothetical protein
MLLLNHQAECLCKAFKTSCGHLKHIEMECEEIIRRADSISEAIELAYDLGQNEREKALYCLILGRIIERLEKQERHENG